ncbi:hypothetical protein FHD67_16810 [Paracoccus haeundaensis]|uniref:Sodium:proton antiporter n=1 Tax=Paracoccus haeundaensis TaxID=225362 RepID=A0A5C4R2A8_9RHOB|nr:hypothetical protein FHD67_16810 [Paracoccus haeundaensis]
MQGLTPVQVVALVGVLGVGAQWLAWRLRLPAIVLMLGVGLPVCALLPNLGPPDAGVFRLGHGDGLAAPPG